MAKIIDRVYSGTDEFLFQDHRLPDGDIQIGGSVTPGYGLTTLNNCIAINNYNCTSNSSNYSLAIGSNCYANANYALSFGFNCKSYSDYSISLGYYTTANNQAAVAVGSSTSAAGLGSFAEGCNTKTIGIASHAEGYNTSARGNYSHAEGYYTLASGQYSHAEGQGTSARGNYTHAEGEHTSASGDCSHAEGYYTTAKYNYSHAGGYYTITTNDYETVIGKYNNSSRTDSPLFVVGNGTYNNRSDAFVVFENGTVSAKTITAENYPRPNITGDGLIETEETSTNLIIKCSTDFYNLATGLSATFITNKPSDSNDYVLHYKNGQFVWEAV